MTRARRLVGDRRGAAAAEMALVIPLLCTILFGSVELGSYLYNQHILTKAVRDGARFAARQSFTLYGCSGVPGGTVEADTRALVRTALLAGGTDRFADIQDADITLSTSCKTTQGGQSMTGIYRNATGGAPIVTVAANVDYVPVVGVPFGFSGAGFHMRSTQQAAVMGI